MLLLGRDILFRVRPTPEKLDKLNSLQPSSTRLWLKPHPPINEPTIVTALSRQPLDQTGINASPSEMGAVQDKRTVFSTRLRIGGQQWPTQSQPRHFQNGAQRQPCCLHPSGASHLCIGGQQWSTQSQPRHFQSGAQRQPCCLHPSGAATHLPLSRPFCCCESYLVKSLQEVTSEKESFMTDISGYIRERVK